MLASKKVGIVDYGVGNLSSVKNALYRIGVKSIVSSEQEKLDSCSHLILPGVGAFYAAMRELQESGLIGFLEAKCIHKDTPILGICVGMQLMLEFSEEDGYHEGLGWVKGGAVRMPAKKGFKVPHVGWNSIETFDDALFMEIDDYKDYYFDHSYYCQVEDSEATSFVNYSERMPSSFKKNHIVGVQFHPEKSNYNGLKLLKNFITKH